MGGPCPAPLKGSLGAVVQACDGPRTSELLQQLLDLEAQLAGGTLQHVALQKQSSFLAEGFSILAHQFDPRSISPDPHITHAAEAAKRKILHSLATEAMTVVPKMEDLDPLMATLAACAKTGYGWGSIGAGAGAGSGAGEGEGKSKGKGKGPGKGKGNGKGRKSGAQAGLEAGPMAESGTQEALAGAGTGTQAETEAEVPLAKDVLQRMTALAGNTVRMHHATQFPDGSVDGDKHARLWEALASCPPSEHTSCKALLDASARELQTSSDDQLPGGTWPYRILLALVRMRQQIQVQSTTLSSPVFEKWLAASRQRAGSLDNRQLCGTVAALGKLLLAHEARAGPSTGEQQRRAALRCVALPVLKTIQHVRLRLQSQQVEGTGKAQRGGKKKQQAAGMAKLLKAQKRAKREQKKEAKSFDGREACQLVQGLAMISQAFGGYVDNIVNGGGEDTGGVLQEAHFIAAHATAAAGLAASKLATGAS